VLKIRHYAKPQTVGCYFKTIPMRPISIILLCFLSLCFIQKTNGQSRETKKLIKEVKRNIKSHSIVKDSIDWTELNKTLKSISYTNNHNSDKEKVYGVFIKFLKQAGDSHSLFVSKEISSGIKNSQAENIYTTSKYLGENIGYLKIPYCFTFDYQKDLTFADTIVKQIEQLDSYEIDKWIIDLRDNKGGNVWPMLSGLTPIIGDGLINYSIGNSTENPNFIKQGSITNSRTSTLIYKTKRKFKKLAVLVNNYTASSGEMLAISLLGFKETKCFGGKTSGLTTSNRTFNFNDGTILFLSTGFMADKNKKVYRDGITPDIVFGTDLNEDEIITEIIKWFKE